MEAGCFMRTDVNVIKVRVAFRCHFAKASKTVRLAAIRNLTDTQQH